MSFFHRHRKDKQAQQQQEPDSPSSVYHEEGNSDPALVKYLNDAMRNTKKPDRLGQFFDPIRRKQFPLHSNDPTNTGA